MSLKLCCDVEGCSTEVAGGDLGHRLPEGWVSMEWNAVPEIQPLPPELQGVLMEIEDPRTGMPMKMRAVQQTIGGRAHPVRPLTVRRHAVICPLHEKPKVKVVEVDELGMFA